MDDITWAMNTNIPNAKVINETKEKVESLERLLKDGLPERMSRSLKQKELEQEKKKLENMQPPELNKIQKDKLKEMIRKEENRFRETALTKEELYTNPPGAADKLIYYQSKYGERDMLLKQWKRMLDPTDPNAGNLEQLRK